MVKDWMSLSWKMLMVRGAIGIVIGILALVWPIETALAFAFLWGIWALADGISSLVQAFTPEGRDGRVWLGVMGVVALIAGIVAITSPGLAATALTWFLGIWLIVRAGFEAFAAFSSTHEQPRWLLLVGAALSLLLGVLFVANPGAGAVGIAVWFGIVALLWGIAFVAMGFAVRHDLPASGQQPLAHA
jgi:uncharacterized membrane protein HdeD (DUF308 family)